MTDPVPSSGDLPSDEDMKDLQRQLENRMFQTGEYQKSVYFPRFAFLSLYGEDPAQILDDSEGLSEILQGGVASP